MCFSRTFCGSRSEVVADLLECSVHGYVCQPRTAARSVGRAVAPNSGDGVSGGSAR